jgi:hypothetical protein
MRFPGGRQRETLVDPAKKAGGFNLLLLRHFSVAPRGFHERDEGVSIMPIEHPIVR